MKSLSFFSLIALTIFITSCSYFSEKFESIATSKSTNKVKNSSSNKNNYCSDSSRLQFTTEDESTHKYYRQLTPTFFENKNYNFIEKAIMLSLIEMSRRPDESSPYSRFQVYLKYNEKIYYFDFRPKNLEDDSKMPFIFGLDYLSTNFLKNSSLTAIANKLDQAMPNAVNVSSDFENFLSENKNDLLKNETLSNYFFKGDEILTKFETFDRVNFQSIINLYLKNKKINQQDYVFDKNDLMKVDNNAKDFNIRCNFNYSKEHSPKDEFIYSDLKRSHYMSIAEGENFFIGISSAILHRPFITDQKNYFMKARPSPFALPICEFSGENQSSVLVSTQGRDPAQHLKHLVSYEINQVDSLGMLNELLKFSRHLFIGNPDRILYESKRGRKAQLDFFLTMNFPIYHVENLGDIIGYAKFNRPNGVESSLLIDDRSLAKITCKP